MSTRLLLCGALALAGCDFDAVYERWRCDGGPCGVEADAGADGGAEGPCGTLALRLESLGVSLPGEAGLDAGLRLDAAQCHAFSVSLSCDGAPRAPSSPLALELISVAGQGRFFSDDTCRTPVSSVTLPAGATSAPFFVDSTTGLSPPDYGFGPFELVAAPSAAGGPASARLPVTFVARLRFDGPAPVVIGAGCTALPPLRSVGFTDPSRAVIAREAVALAASTPSNVSACGATSGTLEVGASTAGVTWSYLALSTTSGLQQTLTAGPAMGPSPLVATTLEVVACVRSGQVGEAARCCTPPASLDAGVVTCP